LHIAHPVGYETVVNTTKHKNTNITSRVENMILDYIIVILLVILSGLFSGLTLGLMSLNVHDLRRKVKVGNKYAQKIYPVRKQGNMLLTTLLLGNVAVNSALAVFLGSVTAGIAAAVISTGLIVVFGEIIPQSLFSRYALKFGARFIWVVKIFLYIFYPITKPLSAGLDYFVGKELPTIFSRKELRYLLQEHKEHKESDLNSHEFAILEAGLKYSEKTVKEVMTPLKNTFFVDRTAKLNRSILASIQKKGHSRIPVIDRKKRKIVGVLYMKDLVAISPVDAVPVKQIMRKDVLRIREVDRLDKVLHAFQQKKVHMFVVNDMNKKFTGIITLEDVLEEIVGEIVDEHDLRADMREAA
jgi:metal transporter CNNM